MWFDVGGAANLAIAGGTGPALVRDLAAAFAPYGSRPELPARIDVLVEASLERPELQDIENSAGDGLVTAWDGARAYVLQGRHACMLPDPLREVPATFAYTPGFPIHELARTHVRTAVALAGLRSEAVVIHASAVSINGRAVLIGGWSESGKTETALALAELGAEFLSDKWTIVRADGTVWPFPASVGVRRWVLPYLPKLRASLSRSARVQLRGAAAAAFASRPLRRSFHNAVLREISARSTELIGLADRAALSLEQVRAAYGSTDAATRPVPLGLVVLLSTVQAGVPVQVAPALPAVLASRLSAAAQFERRSYYSVTQRVRFGGAGSERTDGRTVAEIEEGILRTRFAEASLLQVRTPFPADPRRVAESIERIAAG